MATTQREGAVARLFGLKGESWMRHANAASVWSRFSCLSLIALAVWSRDWFGWWSLVPIALSIAWLMLNPLAFDKPASTRNWASKAVFGERISTEHPDELPEQFRSRIPMIANVFQAAGLALMIYGLVRLDVLSTVAGIVMAHLAKLWYLDRMVLLYEDMKHRSAEYAAWEY